MTAYPCDDGEELGACIFDYNEKEVKEIAMISVFNLSIIRDLRYCKH